ncbi:MAG: hypothetical protein HY866_03150 [Chloroflexi bacterium]|nr:hypothetical protein [Chloroflexota bacterium]
MFGGVGCYLSTILVFYVHNLLVLLVPVLAFWFLLLGLTLAPVVVEERERQTWDVLRTTPLTTEAILLGKASGALWWMSDLVHLMIGLLILISMGIGLISLVITPTTTAGYPTGIPDQLLCAATVIVPPVAALFFIMDRAQQFCLAAAASLAASASSRSVRAALASACGAAMVVWIVDVALALLAVVLLQPERFIFASKGDWLALLTLGPMVSYLASFSLLKTTVCLLATLLLREFAVRALWRWTMHAACEL